MTTIAQRKAEIIKKAALQAFEQPLLSSGLWDHQDIRTNYYMASYLFAAVEDPNLHFPHDPVLAHAKATDVFMHILELQDRNPSSETYGHWPLQLSPIPSEADPHRLPVELMGSLMVYFYKEYASSFSQSLLAAFDSALRHVYHSNFYRKPIEIFSHHEAKYTAAKLIYGQFFADSALLEDGYSSLKQTLDRIQNVGMHEYGCLPWFWHWVQAFNCAWELAENAEIKAALSEILEVLWHDRSVFYLKGTWIGPHSRGLPQDIPQDRNVLFDYVQYGDFEMPDHLPRTEYAGFLLYPASDATIKLALQHTQSTEVTKLIPRVITSDEPWLHSYVYRTPHYAIGGMWERVQEHDNEQLRWDVTLPLQHPIGGVNQAFFFHPGQGHTGGDPRHQSEFAEVLYDHNVIVSLYPIPHSQGDELIGVLPIGKWIYDQTALYGCCENVFFAIFLMHPYQADEQSDRIVITSHGRPNGVVVEVIDMESARGQGLLDLTQFADAMRAKAPSFKMSDSPEVTYTSLHGKQLALHVDGLQHVRQTVNGLPVAFSRYTR